jgi:hypothetical protein
MTPQQRFDNAVEQIRSVVFRRELTVREIPSPERIAPRSFALAGDVLSGDTDADSQHGSGRLILLHDSDSRDQWGSDFRIVCFAQAPLELEIGEDAFLAEVTWSWLMDGLETRDARFTAPSGTATKILSTGFGSLSGHGSGAQVELRASWTPIDDNFHAHAQGWAELLCLLAGLPLDTDGVSSIREHRAVRD